ncbi:UDP-3-O-[3-hydroxymyristoyl] N-acetylglucosamine deacetylase [bacterium]|nr:UDP-3-O-[3-hydroxymyristoyl] N-acetylglucosamine deacetylase [bacterium]
MKAPIRKANKPEMTEKQHTLNDVAIIEGMGVFTGAQVRVEIHPAPVDHGPSFEQVLNETSTQIGVNVKNIIETENRTVLGDIEKPECQVNLVEHVLGTLHGLGVDNALIRVNSNEVPLIDGSALPFINAVDKVGLREQDAERKEIVIEKPLFIDDNALLMALPSNTLKITYFLDHPRDFVGKRITHIEVTPDNFRKRIGPARTFIKAEKVKDLVDTGAVKHDDQSQVLVIHKDKVSQPLRFADEFCYHKMLDILGDLYLGGRRIRGHIIGVRSGHYQNRKMIRKIVEEYL